MKYQLLILSEDAVFARMLELEFRIRQMTVRTSDHTDDTQTAEVTLLDLDSVLPPAGSRYGRMIGFTREFSVSAVDPDRRCSMILHRPFEMRLLCEEVLALFSDRDGAVRVQSALCVEGNALTFGEEQIALSPNEKKIMECLLARRGEVVSREEINALIGDSTANKPEVYVCFLRKKLEALRVNSRIRTVRGKGYRLE